MIQSSSIILEVLPSRPFRAENSYNVFSDSPPFSSEEVFTLLWICFHRFTGAVHEELIEVSIVKAHLSDSDSYR